MPVQSQDASGHQRLARRVASARFAKHRKVAPLNDMAVVREKPRMPLRQVDEARVVAKGELDLGCTPIKSHLELFVAMNSNFPVARLLLILHTSLG